MIAVLRPTTTGILRPMITAPAPNVEARWKKTRQSLNFLNIRGVAA